MQITKAILSALLFIICCSIAAVAQTTTGTLVGTVIDPDLKPIKGALVRVVNATNGFGYGRRTDADGVYRIDFLPAGIYDITAAADGFQPNLLPKFLVEVNREKIIKPPPIKLLPVASIAPLSTVKPDNGVQVDIADATLRGNATAELLTALPLANIRSFDTFAQLVPGVAPPPANNGANGPGVGPGVGTAGQFSVNGQRARANNFTIDGSDNNDQDIGVRRQGFTPTIPQSIESITEFQITTLLSDAEAGRNTGGQINVVSRSGANGVHSEFYDLFTDDAFNARDFFDLQIPGINSAKKAASTRNQLGGTFGLPIIKDRLQLFTAFEHQDLNRSQVFHFSVPTLAERQQALAQGKRSLGAIVLSGRDVLNLYPLPNSIGGPYGVNNFAQLLNNGGDGTIFSLRVDHQFALFNHLSTLTARFNFTDDETRIPVVDNAVNSSIDARTRTENLAFTLNSELGEHRSNQLRFSFGRTALKFNEVPGSPFIFQSTPTVGDRTGDNIADGRTGPIGRLLLSPFSAIGVDPFTFPQSRANNTFQIADTLIFTRGHSTTKFGVDLRRVQFNSRLDRNYRAQLSFNSNLILSSTRGGGRIGSGADSAALGVASDFFQTLAVTPDSRLGLRSSELNLFVQQSLRLHARVNLEVGLRYELNTVPTDVNRRIEKILGIKDSDLKFDPNDILAPSFLIALAAQRQFVDGREKIYQSDRNNFAPRIGIAWDITGRGRLSLRAGYGLFYDQILGNVISQSRNIFPNFLPINFGAGTPSIEFLNLNPAFFRFGINGDTRLIQPGTVNTIGVPPDQLISRLGGFLAASGFSLAFTLPEKNLRTPYVHQYSFTLEQAIGAQYIATLSYVGTASHKLLRFRAPNGGPFTSLAFVLDPNSALFVPLFQQKSRPNKVLGAITVFEDSANANYHALQASLTRRVANGIGLQLAYTYSHAIDEVSDLFDLAGSALFAQDELSRREGLRAERGDANFDVRHRFTIGGQYQAPVRWLKGLQLSGILTLQTGQPFTVNTSLDVNLDGNLTDRLNSINGLIVKDQGRTRIQLAPGASLLGLLAPIALRDPRNGAIGRNTFRAAGIATLDLALERSFSLKESRLSLRVEAFNLFNRSHFSVPVRILESPGFGSSVSTALPARVIQFVARYSF